MCDFSGSSSFAAASRSCKTEISIASNTSLCSGIARQCYLSKSWKMVKVGRLVSIYDVVFFFLVSMMVGVSGRPDNTKGSRSFYNSKIYSKVLQL